MKIFDNVYMLDSTKGSYVYIVTGNETALIDTGFPWKGKSIIRELKSMDIRPQDIKHILLTHHDIDHVGNAFMLQQLTGAAVWASEEDIPYICGDAERHGFKKYFRYLFRIKNPRSIRAFIPGRKINGIEVLSTPGHTPGHVCFLYEDILFAGDLAENKKGKLRPYPSPWNWDNALALESFRSLSAVSFKWICPAHGAPIERGLAFDV